MENKYEKEIEQLMNLIEGKTKTSIADDERINVDYEKFCIGELSPLHFYVRLQLYLNNLLGF